MSNSEGRAAEMGEAFLGFPDGAAANSDLAGGNPTPPVLAAAQLPGPLSARMAALKAHVALPVVEGFLAALGADVDSGLTEVGYVPEEDVVTAVLAFTVEGVLATSPRHCCYYNNGDDEQSRFDPLKALIKRILCAL